MDQETNQGVGAAGAAAHEPGRRVSRRSVLKVGACGLAAAAAAGVTAWYARSRVAEVAQSAATAEVFKGDAPPEDVWQRWQARGWVREARHYLKLGRNVQCKTCPNDCLLEPGDRSHCRNRVNRDGTLYTLAYGNPCSFRPDPIEKKPLFHFLPGTGAFSIATSGCVFRCLNCQNWEISQARPEDTKDASGEPVRLDPQRGGQLTQRDLDRLSMFPEDVVALAEHFRCPSIAYTYSEPTAWHEYMLDTCALARQRKIKNVWVTCGYMNREPLSELCKVLDAANVDLKGFSEESYRQLNSGRLQPVLDALKFLKREGVWIELGLLIVPTYTDDPETVRRLCGWILENLGPGCPLHFLRFIPRHKLENLPPTPLDVLVEARRIARQAGLHFVYLGNVREVDDAETTYCPGCGKTLIEREAFEIVTMNVSQGTCKFCGAAIAGVWTAPSGPRTPNTGRSPHSPGRFTS